VPKWDSAAPSHARPGRGGVELAGSDTLVAWTVAAAPLPQHPPTAPGGVSLRAAKCRTGVAAPLVCRASPPVALRASSDDLTVDVEHWSWRFFIVGRV